MGLKAFPLECGQKLRFEYTNHRNETEMREVEFRGLDYGDNEWYPERQWFLRCYDPSRDAFRSFALTRIDGMNLELLP